MILETLLILFLFSLFSKGSKNKKEAQEFLNKSPEILTVLNYLNKDYVSFADNSTPSKKIAEYLNKDIREVELCLKVLIEKKLAEKVITKSELYPIKYSITVLGRNVMTERIRKENQNKPNTQKKPVNNRPKNNGALFDRINENTSKDKQEKPKEIKPKTELPKNSEIPINFTHMGENKNLSFEIGEAFENFVAEELFPDHHFTLTHRTPSFAMNNKRFCESSLKPDLGFRDKKTGKEFYVECKFRGSLNEDGKYNWTKDKDQANRYRNIQKNENKQVFVAMGLGGMSDDPRNIFLVPIDEIKYLELYPSVLQNWEVYNIYDIFKILNS